MLPNVFINLFSRPMRVAVNPVEHNYRPEADN